jgi:hypothetical protein
VGILEGFEKDPNNPKIKYYLYSLGDSFIAPLMRSLGWNSPEDCYVKRVKKMDEMSGCMSKPVFASHVSFEVIYSDLNRGFYIRVLLNGQSWEKGEMSIKEFIEYVKKTLIVTTEEVEQHYPDFSKSQEFKRLFRSERAKKKTEYFEYKKEKKPPMFFGLEIKYWCLIAAGVLVVGLRSRKLVRKYTECRDKIEGKKKQ